MSLSIQIPIEKLLPAQALAELNLLASRIQQLINAGRGWTVMAKRLAPEWGIPYATLRGHYYSFKKHGKKGLVDSRKFRIDKGDVRGLPDAFLEYWQGINEQAKRATAGRQSWRYLRDQLDAWRRGDDSKRIPGYDTPPRNQPGKEWPFGWSYGNLIKLISDKADRTLAQIGGRAASKYLPQIYTTRVGIQPGQVIMLDDQWHDVEVYWDGGTSGRPLSFDLLDLASGYEVIDGIQPRIKNEETGKWMALKEQDAFWLTLTHLMRYGYHAELGTLIIIEAGTASFSSTLAEGLRAASNGKIITNKGDTHNSGLKGLIFDGTRKGNFRFKASRESLFNLARNLSAHLIGGTGKDIANNPEEHEVLKHYLKGLMKQVPEDRRLLLKAPFYTEKQYRDLMADMKTVLNHRTWHNLEGWETAGYRTTEFRLPGSNPDDADWMPIEAFQKKLLELPPAHAEILALALTTGGLTRSRKLSPAEVWESGQHKLVRLNAWHLHQVIPASMAHQRTVEDNMEIRLYGIGPEVLRYDARISNVQDMTIFPKRGQSLLIYVNPFEPDTALACDTNGTPIGTIARIIPHTRVDNEGYMKRQREVTEMKRDLKVGVTRRAEPVATDRAAMVEHNQRVIRGLPVTAAEHEAHDKHTQAATTAASIFDTSTYDDSDTPPTHEDDEPNGSAYFGL